MRKLAYAAAGLALGLGLVYCHDKNITPKLAESTPSAVSVNCDGKYETVEIRRRPPSGTYPLGLLQVFPLPVGTDSNNVARRALKRLRENDIDTDTIKLICK